MDLLVIMNFFPFPPKVGTCILAYNNLKELSKRHSIHLVCLDAPRNPVDFPPFVKQLHFVPRKKRSYLMKLLFYPLFSIFKGVPISFSSNISSAMKKKVDELVKHNKIDAILCYGMSSMQHVRSSCYKKTIVIIEDPESLKMQRMKELPVVPFIKKLLFLYEIKLFAHIENSLLPKVAKVVFLSKADVNDLNLKVNVNVGTVSYGVDIKGTDIMDCLENREEGVIVFSGNMYHLPNVDGALFFLREIFPIVLKANSKAILWIVGSRPDDRIIKLAKKFKAQVLVTGYVNNVSIYISRAKVCICPVRLKIGVQTKVLEALSLGTPVVTTSAGNSGIGGQSGTNLIINDDPTEFAQSVIALLKGDKWNNLSYEGRKFVKENFSWKRSAEELEKHIQLVVKT